ncbi:lysine--tRNA ligase [Clostridium sp. CAG:356]|nr:lysine--tRNA ligase [Clostridium sp. CAG:356]
MQESKNQNQEVELDENHLIQIRKDKLKELQEQGKDPFEITKFNRTNSAGEIKANYEKFENKDVTVAGRIIAKRIMGKASFCTIQDSDEKIQSYVSINDLGEESYKAFKTWDIGDIIGITGFVFKTRTEEISVHAKEVTLLSKSLRPLPEKFHGLKDVDLRYRQRYVDLIMNPEVKETFRKRSQIISEIRKILDEKGYLEVETPVLNTISGGATARPISEIRKILDEKGFLEVETPVLNTISGGATARPFITHHNTLNIPMYLRIATELNLKRLIVGGYDKVYEMGRIFRNEGMDIRHNPEFTTIELYAAYQNYHDMMDITEELFQKCAMKVCGTTRLTYQGTEIDLGGKWKRVTMIDSIKEACGVDFNTINTDEEAVALAKERKLEIPAGKETRGHIISLFFDEYVEKTILQPTFIYDYPVEISPLAKRSPKDPRLTERFEVFIDGREYGNAFSELNDPIDQYERFKEEIAARENGDDEAGMMDEDFINALEYGMPPTGGLGIGIDRLVMLLTDSASIRDVLLFPTMKPLGSSDNKKINDIPENNDREEVIDFSKVEIEPLFKDYVDFDTFSKSDFRAVKVRECVAVPKSKKLLKFTLDDGTDTERIILSGIHPYYEPEELIGKTLIAITNLPPRAMMGIDSCGMLLSAVHTEEGEEKLHLLMVDNHIPAGAKLY